MKRIAIVVVTLFSCTASTEEQNKEIVAQMFAAFNAHDWQKMTTFYSPEAAYLDPSFGTKYVRRSHGEIIVKYSEMEKMFSNIHDDVQSIYATGDKVIVEFVSSGSSGDSIKFSLPICAVLTLQNGKIVRDATYYDNQ
jgi:ketosteroid isomerase-like protein